MARYVMEMNSDLAVLLKNAGQVKIIETLEEDGFVDTGSAPLKPSSSVPTTPPISGPRVSEEGVDPVERDTPHQTPPTPASRGPRRSIQRYTRVI